MTTLITTLSEGDARKSYVSQLIDCEKWDNVYVITAAPFPKGTCIILDDSLSLPDLVADLKKKLPAIHDVEVAVNFNAGTGKLSMAVLAALLKTGVGIRLVAHTKEQGLQEL